MIDIVLLILFCHFLGDFPLQHWLGEMSIKKSSSFAWLTVHVCFYSIPFFLLSWVTDISPSWVMFNFGAHLVVDFFTSKLTSHFYKAQKMRWFWFTVGIDQLLHTAILIKSYDLLIGFNL